MKIIRHASVVWQGGIKTGKGECPVSKLFNASITLHAALVDRQS